MRRIINIAIITWEITNIFVKLLVIILFIYALIMIIGGEIK